MEAYFVRFDECDSAYVVVPPDCDNAWQYAMWSALSLFLYESEVDASEVIDGFIESKARYPEVSRVPALDGDGFSLRQLIDLGLAEGREDGAADMDERVTAMWLSTEW